MVSGGGADPGLVRRRAAPARRLHTTSTPSPISPTPVSHSPNHSTPVRAYCSSTCFSVGTTTMKFGVARYGPSAPLTRQFGKYDVFTSTGLPTWSTSKLTELSLAWTFVTCAGFVIARRGRRSAAEPGAWRHDDGPLATTGLSSWSGNHHHGAAIFCSHPLGSGLTPSATTGWYVSPSTSGA